MILNELLICYKKKILFLDTLHSTRFYNLNTKLSFPYSSIINTGWFKNADLLSTLYETYVKSFVDIITFATCYQIRKM